MAPRAELNFFVPAVYVGISSQSTTGTNWTAQTNEAISFVRCWDFPCLLAFYLYFSFRTCLKDEYGVLKIHEAR